MNPEENALPKIFPHLTENPTENSTEWYKSVRQLFASLMSHHFQYGLLHLVVSEDEFSKYPGNMDLTDPADPQPIPPPNPLPPGPIAAGAGAGTIHTHRLAHDLSMEYIKAKALGRRLILESVGPDIRDELTDHLAGETIMATIPEIVKHVKKHYGTRTAEDLRKLRNSLREPIAGQDVSTFLTFSVKFKNTVGKLAVAGQPLSALDQIDCFQEATMGQPGIAEAFNDYVKANPNLADRNLVHMCTFIRAQLANATASSLGYAGAATGSNIHLALPTAPHPREIPTLAGLTIADVTKVIDSALDKRLGAARSTQGGGQRAKHYCYRHGYNNTHPGRDCNVMKADSATYLPAMLQARTPTQVPGGHK